MTGSAACVHCTHPIDLRTTSFTWVHTDSHIAACAPPFREFYAEAY